MPPPASTPAAVLQAQALRATRPDGSPLFTLDALTLYPGLTWVLGDEGRGKTTLLRLLAGTQPAQVGAATLAGHALHTDPAAYARAVAWFDPTSTAWESTVVDALWAALAADYPGWNADLLGDLAEALDLAPHRHKPLYMLSAGSRRKALMAAALASGAPLTLLDMPFAALDAATCRTLREILADAAGHPHRAFVLADYTVPATLPRGHTIDLDTLEPH